MESLDTIEASLKNEWDQISVLQVLERLVCVLSQPAIQKKIVSQVWRMAEIMKVKLGNNDKSELFDAFLKAAGNFHLQLRLFRRLGLPNNLKVLARLIQQWFKSNRNKSIGKFKAEFDPAAIKSPFFPAVLYICQPPARPEVVKYFKDKYLVDKPSRDDRNLLPLLKPALDNWPEELVVDSIHSDIKRMCLRSASALPLAKELYEVFSCDYSKIITDFTFPTLIEYLNKPEDFQNTLDLLKVLIGKSKNLGEFVSSICGIRNINEGQIMNILNVVKMIPKEHAEQLLDYVTSLSQRVKTESNRGLIAQSIKHLISVQNAPEEFLAANQTNAYFVNIIFANKLQIKLNFNQNTPLALISVLSIQMPEQLTPKIVNLFNESSSVLYSVQNLSEDEAFALTRTIVNGLKVYPDNINLLKRFSRSLVSNYRVVREYCLQSLPKQGISKILAFLKEFVSDETHLANFSSVFYKFVKSVKSLLASPEDVDNFLLLLSDSNLYNAKRMKFVLKSIGKNQLEYTENVFDDVNAAGLALSLPNFAENLKKLVVHLDLDQVLKTRRTKDYICQVYDDPNFDEIGKFNALCKEIVTSAGFPGNNIDQATVMKALGVLWDQNIRKTQIVLRSLGRSIKFRALAGGSQEFFEYLAFNTLPYALKLAQVDELQGDCWDFFFKLISASPTFSSVAWHFAVSLHKCARNQWNDKSFSSLFKFVGKRINIHQLTPSESFALERVSLWVLRQSGTSLRSTSLNILVDFLRNQKFTNIQEVIIEICLLISNYSSPTLNSLFVPLIDILKPKDWEPFMHILLNLQPNTKQVILDSLLQYESELPNDDWLVTPVYLCLFDDTDLVSSSAAEVWEKNKLELSESVLIKGILPFLFSENLELTVITAQGVTSAINKFPAWTGSVLSESKKLALNLPQKDGFIKFLQLLCPVLHSKSLILDLQEYLLENFMTSGPQFLEIAILYLNTYGELYLNEFFTIIQQRTICHNEAIRNSAVVLAGYLAKFFSPDDFRIESTIELLLKALDLPSDLLFSTISKCLPRLVSYRLNLIEPLIATEFKKLTENRPISERRGAGYGIGCLIKGGGIKNLVSLSVLDKLESIINNKKAPDCEKAGVLIAIEGLGAVLGRSFEPYLGEVLPFIIDCFANKDLQEQAALSTKVMISKLSAHGMKRILPQLTHGLEETKWRSKVGAIEALGKMAFCAPKQLSAALPNIVPQVIKAFSDTNPKVLEAANKAISDIGSVITNPEIFQLVPVLSRALGDISHLSEAFKVIIDTTFHHYLDTASLSLIVPLVETGLKSRNAEYKKQACQIVGGITSLIRSPNEFLPYIDRVTTAVKFSLFDSLPEVRNIAAQNLALFCQGLGEDLSKNIISWLKDTMEKSNLNYERSGAVHALSEYLLYDDRWEHQLDHLLNMCKDSTAIIKESYLGLFIFIPLNTQGQFEHHLARVMPAFLERLSDDNEEVRKIAIRVMQLIIQTYCKNSMDIILPQLEIGLFDKNWRKRASCITLIGEMIEKIESLSRKEATPLISTEHKNRILASIYILRADHTSNINSQAAQIWKAHVDNTPKFLVSLTPELVLRLIEISDNSELEPREIASYAIQNLIQKYQNKIFSSYLKHFLNHFEKYPKGVAFVLRTVCEAASRNLLVNNTTPIISILEVLLKSNDLDYLHNAGGIFHDLYQKTNIERPDPAVMILLEKMVEYPFACRELLGFKNVGITKSLLPKIMQSPERSKTLPVIGKIVANELFSIKGLESLFPTALKELNESEEMLISIQILLSSLTDPPSIIKALNLIQESVPIHLQLILINHFCKNTTVTYENFVDKLLKMVLSNLGSDEDRVLKILPETVKLTLAPIEKEDLPDYFQIFKTQLNSTNKVPLFNIPKSLEPFLPFIQNSLMYGNVEIKELAARSYYEVIKMTEPEILNAYAVMIVGPLIRVLSEKVPGDVKMSILDALYLLLQKTPLKLKPFVSQLQSTFTKALNHSEFTVRESASRNIIELLKMKPRLDLIFGDLGTLVGNPDVIGKSLETLSKIIKSTEVPSQLLSSTCNKIISELSTSTSNEIATEAGKLVLLINMDLSAIIHSLDPIEPSVFFLASILNRSPPAALQMVTPWIENGLRVNFEDTVKIVELIYDHHPNETWDLARKYFREFGRNILASLGALNKLPAEKLNLDLEALGKVFPALAKACLSEEDEDWVLRKTVIHIFMVKEKGIKNILKALHLLDEETQGRFRAYAQDLGV